MFVAAPVARSREHRDLRGLVLGFLPKTDAATLLELSRISRPARIRRPDFDYMPCTHEPRDMTRSACDRSPSPHRDAGSLPPPGAVSTSHRSRTSIRDILQDLLALGEDAVEDALAANPAFPCPDPALFTKVAGRAHHRPPLARILLDRTDLAVTDEAALYLMANVERRRLIRERL